MKKKKKISIKFLKQIKIKKIILNILYIIICILIVMNVTILFNIITKRQEYFSISDFSILSMKDTMMSPKINKNDLLILNNNEEIKINDIICFYSDNEIKVSEVINIIQDNGGKSYITKYNNAYYPSLEEITNEQIIGKVQGNIPLLGILFNILKSKITTVIFIIALILKVLYNKYVTKQLKKRRNKEAIRNGELNRQARQL